jgi:hypothetical protein
LNCAFYLTDFGDLDARNRWLTYDLDFITASGGAYSTLLELRDAVDLALARRMYLGGQKFARYVNDTGIALSREIHMSDDADRFTSLLNRNLVRPDSVGEVCQGEYLALHEGKTLHQFTDRWTTAPRYAIGLAALAGKPMSIESMLYYRAACRDIARSTDERTSIATMLPPGVLCGHTISVERRPGRRPNAAALSLVSLMNSFAFDWLLRQKAAVHVSLYILSELPVPELEHDADRFLSHAALRLCCNHQGFAPLWREQLGEAWHEASAARVWPVMPHQDDRWRLRAAMDAIIARAYGLDCAQYKRVLASFSHKSYQAAPTLCLAAFDDLARKGVADFCRGHDPYCDIPLVTTHARPVIVLPAAAGTQRNLLARTGPLRT